MNLFTNLVAVLLISLTILGWVFHLPALMAAASGVAILLAWFFVQEMLKKFVFFHAHAQGSGRLVSWEYPGAKAFGRPRGMRKIVLRADGPFRALVCFDLKVPLTDQVFVDYYGEVASSGDTIVIETFLGTFPTTFRFFVTCDPASVKITCDTWDQALAPQAVYKPHFIQLLGFWG